MPNLTLSNEIEQAIMHYPSYRKEVKNLMREMRELLTIYEIIIDTGTTVIEKKLEKFCTSMDFDPLHDQMKDMISNLNEITRRMADNSSYDLYKDLLVFYNDLREKEKENEVQGEENE